MLDFKLTLVKKYLDAQIVARQSKTGLPLGTSTIKLNILANSTPGTIVIHISVIEPTAFSPVDVWYDKSSFYEVLDGNWVKFEKFKEEFRSTIVNLGEVVEPSDLPDHLEIVGLTLINKKVQTTSNYKAFIVLVSGVKHPAKLPIWNISVTKDISIVRNASSGDGVLSFSSIRKTTDLVVSATMQAGNVKISGSINVKIELPAVVITILKQILTITGSVVIYSEEKSSYKAIATSYFSNGSTSTTDVTAQVTWSTLPLIGSILQDGTFTALSIIATKYTSISAVLPSTLTSPAVSATLQVQVVVKTVSVITNIIGSTSINELTTQKYTADVKMSNGDVITNYLVDWSVYDKTLGSIDSSGLFNAPSVDHDTPQKIIASISQYNRSTLQLAKQITIIDTKAPVLTIIGVSRIKSGDIADYTATVTFNNITTIVVPVWLSTSNIGNIDSVGHLTTNIVDTDTNGVIYASYQHLNYKLAAELKVVVLTLKVTPLTLTISGLSSITEGLSTTYIATAHMSDLSTKDVTVVWFTSVQKHTIDELGLFIASSVSLPELVTLTAIYTDGLISVNAHKDVFVIDTAVVWTPQSLKINGLSSVPELSVNNYTADVTTTSNIGTTSILSNVGVSWLTDNGSILPDGSFTAPTADKIISILTAVYKPTVGDSLTDTHPVEITKVKLLKSLAAVLNPVSVIGGQPTTILVTLTKTNGNKLDVTTNVNTNYTIDPNIVTLTGNTITTNIVSATTSIAINVSYTESGEIVNTFVTLELLVNNAYSLVITPAYSSVYESETVDFTTTLYLADNTHSLVLPTYIISQPTFGSFVNNTFTAGLVDANTTLTVTASYSGDNVNGIIVSDPATILVKDAYPVSLSIFNDSGTYYVSELTDLVLKASVILSTGTTFYPVDAVFTLVDPLDSAYAKLNPNTTNGFLTFSALDVIADKNVVIKSTYTDPGSNIVVTSTRTITILYVKVIVSLDIKLPAGTIYENTTKVLTVREKYDDGSYGKDITSGITWQTDPNLVSVIGLTASFLNVIVDTPFIIYGTYGIPPHNGSVSGVIVNTVPSSLNLYNDLNVYSMPKHSSLVLKTSVLLSNGSTIYPINPVYTLVNAVDALAATLTLDTSTGFLTVLGLNNLQDTIVTIKSSYTESNITVSSTKDIKITYFREIYTIEVLLPVGSIYENTTKVLTVREKYDDQSYGNYITSGVVWSTSSNVVAMSGMTGSFNEVSVDTPFTITGSYGTNPALTGTVTGTVLDNSVLIVDVDSSKGISLVREDITVLSALITWSNGITDVPNLKYPVIWSSSDINAGTLVSHADYTCTFTAANLTTNKVVVFTATCTDSNGKLKTGSITINIKGFEVPLLAVLSGAPQVLSGANSDYTLNVTYSDNSTIIINASQTTLTAYFTTSYDSSLYTTNYITTKGRLTAPIVSAVSSIKVACSYTDSNNRVITSLPLTVSITLPVVAAPSTAVLDGPLFVASGSISDYVLTVTMTDGTKRIISSIFTTYVASWSTSVLGNSPINGKFTAPRTVIDKNVTIVAYYNEGGIQILAQLGIVVNAEVATILNVTPANITMFKNGRQSYTATLNTGIVVQIPPTNWVFSSTVLGTFDSLGTLTATTAGVSNISAKYSAANTNNLVLVSLPIVLTVTAVIPTSLDLYNDSLTYAMREGETIILNSWVKFNDLTQVKPAITVVYSITAGAAYVTMTQLDGTITLIANLVSTSQVVTVSALYTSPDGFTITNTKNISISSTIATIIDIVADTLSIAPYYETVPYLLRVREYYSDGHYGPELTTGVTWTTSSQVFARVDSTGSAILADGVGNKNITFTPTYMGRTASVGLTLLFLDIVPSIINIFSTNAFTINRDTSTIFSATITRNDNTTTNASLLNPITWSTNTPSAGAFSVVNGYDWKYIAAGSSSDVPFTITASTGGISRTVNVMLHGYPIPVAATVSGAFSVQPLSSTVFALKVQMSDGTFSTVITNSLAWTSTFVLAKFSTTVPDTLVAGAITENGTVSITFVYQGVTLNATANVTIQAAIIPPAANTWDSALYLGTMDATLLVNESTLTTWLLKPDLKNVGKNYINKIVAGSTKFASQVVSLEYTTQSDSTTIYDKYILLFPTSLAPATIQTSTTADFAMFSTITSTSTVTINIGTVATSFTCYRGATPKLTLGLPAVNLYFRGI